MSKSPRSSKPAADKALLAKLAVDLDEAASGLDGITSKRVFGCHALIRNDTMFAMVWKTGRIAVKLPDAGDYGALMAIPGSEPWVAHAVMKHWVLLPKGAETSKSLVQDWVRKAYTRFGVKT